MSLLFVFVNMLKFVIYYKLPDEDLMNACNEAKKTKRLYLYCNIHTDFSKFLPLVFAVNK